MRVKSKKNRSNKLALPSKDETSETSEPQTQTTSRKLLEKPKNNPTLGMGSLLRCSANQL